MIEQSKHTNNNLLTINTPIKQCMNKKKYGEEVMAVEKDQKHFKITIFPLIIGVIFFIFWFITCPLIWSLLYHTVFSEKWPHTWPYFFWIVAILLWSMLMIIIVIIWRQRKNKNYKCHDTTLSKSISTTQPIHTIENEIQLENVKMHETKNSNNEKSSIIPSSLKQKRPILPPLVIHKNMTGQNSNENSGDITIKNISLDEVDEVDDNDDDDDKINESINPNRISQNVNKSSIKEYLKIVTVESPLPDCHNQNESTNSPLGPLSPRELFFIDLIRGAENKESNYQRPYRGSYFFGDKDKSSEIPQDTRRYTMGDSQFRKLLSTDTKKLEELKKASRENVTKTESTIPNVTEENEETLTAEAQNENKDESEYFIANINTPNLKKAEVFLRVESASGNSEKEKNIHTIDVHKEDTNAEEKNESVQ